MSAQPEPWLSGSHADLPAFVRAVIHALELSRDDIGKWCAPLDDAALNARPAGVAPVAFHLRHIVRSLDRLLTYAEGKQLSDEQLSKLKSELEPNATRAGVTGEFQQGIEDALERLRGFVNRRSGDAEKRRPQSASDDRRWAAGSLRRSHSAAHWPGSHHSQNRFRDLADRWAPIESPTPQCRFLPRCWRRLLPGPELR